MMKTRLKFLVMLLAMVVGGVMMFMPQRAKAQGIDGLTADQTFDFVALAQQSTTINYGDSYTGPGLSSNPKYMDNIAGVSLQGRFAAGTTGNNGNKGWWLRNDANKTVGLYCYGASYTPQLAICDMWNGDRVRIKVVGTIKFTVSNSAKVYVNGGWEYVRAGEGGHEFSNCEFVFAAIQSGDVIIEGTGANSTIIQKVEFFYSGNGVEDGVDRGVSFTSPPSTLNVGQTYDGNNANVYPSWATPMFTSSNNAVATVDKYGVVTAVYPGTATITATLDIGPVGNAFAAHDTARFTLTVPYSDEYARYNYDPAVEVYDLSSTTGTYATSQADFQLNGGPANYLTTLSSGLSLNNRIAVAGDNWILDNGLKNHIPDGGEQVVRNVSITNLRAGDRVRITFDNSNGYYGNNHINFGSDANYSGTDLNSSAFKDFNNNGELDLGENMITRNEAVDKTLFYTMTEDGHLDLIVYPQAKITKIEIYGDHQATMVDKYNGSAAAGYTAYFSSTGQLMAKEHIVPGGLEVHIGNENDTQHAIVVSSDKGPVSFVYDQDGYKMARRSDNSTNLAGKAPSTGTFYKFMPEVNGTMTVKLKAYSVKYDSYIIGGGHGKDTGNEHQVSGGCPYYLMIQDGNSYTAYSSTSPKNNGADVTFSNVPVTAGKVYYVYGGWANYIENNVEYTPGGQGFDYTKSYCGVAQLIDVTFIPAHSISRQAKWVANATYDSNTGTYYDNDLADVSGVTTGELYVKKKSDNITACTPKIVDGKLIIEGITFADASKGGGTILIRLGNGENDPVFAYTIAYKASYNNGEGHIWNFSDNQLHGLKWNSTNSVFDVEPFGTSKDKGANHDVNNHNGCGLLYDEMYPASGTSDWTFAYRVKIGDGGNDPMYLNKKPMAGNNANIIWDTEGLIINTGSNQSCINNEYTENGGVINHSDKTNRADPDRYVGILPGGEFTIPCLKQGDRVTIFMGSGNGSGLEAIYMNVTNALDAIGNEITQVYHVGGSMWNANSSGQAHGDPNYRGAYHFIAKADGDMVFKLADKGTLAKLYSIEIYSGKHRWTDDATRLENRTYNGEAYTAYAYQLLNTYNTTNETVAKAAYTLHYRGKGEALRTPTVVYTSGNITVNTTGESPNLVYQRQGNEHNIFYKSVKGEAGLFRMRIDCVDLDGRYVTDYGMQNISVGYLDKMTYPYTWDFTDLMKYAYTDNINRIKADSASSKVYDDANYLYEYMNKPDPDPTKPYYNSVEVWKRYDEGDYSGYGLHVRNSRYASSSDNDGSGELAFTGGGQLYAGSEFITETSGLGITPYGTETKRNGRLRITNQGLYLEEQTDNYWGVTIPEVPANAAVYVRAKPMTGIEAKVRNGNTTMAFPYTTTADGEHIYAVKGTGDDMTLYLKDMVVQKIAVSTDAKTVNAHGWNTESRNHPIDPSLMSYMTGLDFRAYVVTHADPEENTVTLVRIDGGSEDPNNSNADNTVANGKLIVPAAENGSKNAYIVRYVDTTKPEDQQQVNIFNDDKGFHLFAPDMHDNPNNAFDGNLLKAQVSSTTTSGKLVPRDEVVTDEDKTYTYNNYAFTDKHRNAVMGGNYLYDAQAFYRIESGGASSKTGNQAYLSILQSSGSSSSRSAEPSGSPVVVPGHYDIIFKDWKDLMAELGDVNGDGVVSQPDVELLTDYVTVRKSNGLFKRMADMNGDGSVDIIDLTLLVDKLAAGE